MQLHDYIETAATKAGSVAELGRTLGLTREATTAAKSHKRPLPIDACIKLADYIGADRIAVIAANELATERKAEKREFWRPFAQNAKAASIALALWTVTFLVTPTPTEAAQNKTLLIVSICIMLSAIFQLHLKKGQLLGIICVYVKRMFEPSKPCRPRYITQVQGV